MTQRKRMKVDLSNFKSRKVSPEEMQKLMPREGRNHWLAPFLTSLAVGEGFYLLRSDWNWRSRGPAQMVKRLSETTGMRFKAMPCSDGSGWVIRRDQ